jgi:hypothetical protein
LENQLLVTAENQTYNDLLIRERLGENPMWGRFFFSSRVSARKMATPTAAIEPDS